MLDSLLNKLFKSKKFAVKKIAIYSAIYGDFDDLREQIPQSINCDFILFTDNKKFAEENTSSWEIRVDTKDYLKDLELNESYKKVNIDRLRAKYFKCNPHLVLPEYDYTLWIDASGVIKTKNFSLDVLNLMNDKNILLITHPERDDIYEEALFCKDWPKYKDMDIMGQVNHYKSLGYPVKNGLSAGGLVARDTSDEIKKFNEDWWNENVKWTYQDQLSLEFVLWQDKINVKKLDVNLWDNNLIEFKALDHKKNI